jgi:hypothetical protein
MRKIFIRTTAAVVSVLTTLVLAGCSAVSTESNMTAVHYDGGPLISQSFIDCVPAATYYQTTPNHSFFLYPMSLRTYSASDDSGAESGMVTVVSSDNIEVSIPASVTFTLDTTCEKLRKFHEMIGLGKHAYWGGGDIEDSNQDGTPDGWVNVLNFYVGAVLDTTLDRASQGYTWQALWNDPAAKAALEQSVEENLSKMVDDRMGDHYFEIQTILLQKPIPPENLRKAKEDEQTAVAKSIALLAEAEANETSKVAQAKAAQAEAEAQIAVAKAEAAQIEEQIRVMGKDAWLKKYGIDHGITPWPNPVVPGANVGK